MNDLEVIGEIAESIGQPLIEKACGRGPKDRFWGPVIEQNRGCYERNESGRVSSLAIWVRGGLENCDKITPLLEKLEQIELLSISYGGIEDVSCLGNLKSLKYLCLYGNHIRDISALKDLRKLRLLYLHRNRIESLPGWITDFDMEISLRDTYHRDGFINLSNNPLTSPPPEVVKQGNAAIRSYFRQLSEQREDYLFEAKVLIVGEPGAGKTSLTWKLQDPNSELPEPGDTTKGIDVSQHFFPLHVEDLPSSINTERLDDRQFRLNLWDFGGQEIYKATHRFFLSRRSLYALVADSRNEDTDFNYWLHIVEMFGGDSPLLIVLNEKHKRKRNLDTSAMLARFPNITEVLDVDLAEEDLDRLGAIRRAVRYYASQLPHVGAPVPRFWSVLREALEADQRNTISLKEYLELCHQSGIKQTRDALTLSQYFHDIGVFLHFQDDDLLNKTLFLNPNWATGAVYQLLDHPLLNEKNGRFSKADAASIWQADEFELLRDELLRLMQRFFLTYEIDGSGQYIVPERLPAARPEYAWDGEGNLLLRYSYDVFMPKGIMSQLIVRMHRHVSNHDYVWNRGAVLERDGATAEVTESYDARNIRVRISGRNRRDLMTLITDQLDDVNGQYEKMKVKKLIPCNCGQCSRDKDPFFYEYSDLRRRIAKGRHTVECGRSYDDIGVRSLIDEVINEALSDANRPGTELVRRSEHVVRDRVFVSYSRKDSEMLDRVRTHLRVLENEGVTVNLWDDSQIKPGMKWRDEIEAALAAAKIAVLLVSTDFLASDFIRKSEIPPLLAAAERDGATVLSVILKPCRFGKTSKISAYQAVNDPAQPLSKLSEAEQDEVLLKLTDRIAEVLEEDAS